jgi:hypothetical protein
MCEQGYIGREAQPVTVRGVIILSPDNRGIQYTDIIAQLKVQIRNTFGSVKNAFGEHFRTKCEFGPSSSVSPRWPPFQSNLGCQELYIFSMTIAKFTCMKHTAGGILKNCTGKNVGGQLHFSPSVYPENEICSPVTPTSL